MAKTDKLKRGRWCYERSAGNWWYDFKLKGDRRRRGPLPGVVEQTQAELAAAAQVRTQADLNSGALKPQDILKKVTIEVAFAMFWDEVAQFYATARNAKSDLAQLTDSFGTTKTMDELQRPHVIAHINRRRKAGVADPTIRNEIALLSRVVRRCAVDWHFATNRDLDLTRFGFAGSPHRERTMAFDQERKVLDAIRELRPDFLPAFLYAFAAGQRKKSIMTLRWDHIRWQEGEHGVIHQPKMKERRGQAKTTHTLPLTADMAALIGSQKGKHPEHVFTFLPQRSARFKKGGLSMTKGVPQPFGADTWREIWNKVRDDLGLQGFTFHDIRHVVLSHIRDLTNDITKARDVAGHTSVQATERYIGGVTKNTASALEALAKARQDAAGEPEPEPPTSDPLAEIAALEQRLATLRANLADDNVVPLVQRRRQA
jgi:integrase